MNEERQNKELQLPKIKTTKVVYPQIYSYTLPEFKENEGWQKIGYTEYKDVNKRIREQTETPAKHMKYEMNLERTGVFHQFTTGLQR